MIKGAGEGGEEEEGRGKVRKLSCKYFVIMSLPKAASTANQDTLNGGRRWRGRQQGRGTSPIVYGRPSRQDSNPQKSPWAKTVV